MAGNPSSGGLTNAGIGLGIGLSVAGQVGNIFTGVGQNINANQPGQTRTCSKCGAKKRVERKIHGSGLRSIAHLFFAVFLFLSMIRPKKYSQL
jgi:hypothetical protein